MPPMVIAAGIGAAASIGGGLLASSAQKKAANKAADTATQNTAANNALTRDIYNQNKANLSPFMANGLAASNALNGLLLGAPQTAPQAPSGASPAQHGQPVPASALAAYGGPTLNPAQITYRNGQFFDQGGRGISRQAVLEAYGSEGAPQVQSMAQPVVQPMQQPGTVTTQVQPQSAWDQFRNSTNYQWRLSEGLKGLNQGYAARGLLESGAAMRGINSFGQQFASNELGNYMALLSGQQNMGLSGANALAGVGTNMVGAVTANNNSAASAVANAALMNGNAQANMYGKIAGALGNFAGSFGSSYGR